MCVCVYVRAGGRGREQRRRKTVQKRGNQFKLWDTETIECETERKKRVIVLCNEYNINIEGCAINFHALRTSRNQMGPTHTQQQQTIFSMQNFMRRKVSFFLFSLRLSMSVSIFLSHSFRSKWHKRIDVAENSNKKNPFRSFHNGIIAFVHISNEYETFIFKQFANLETHTRRATDALKQQQQQHEYSMKWKWKKEDAKNAHDHNVKSLDSMLG